MEWNALHYLSWFCQIVTNFQNYFTERLRRKSVITLSLNFLPHIDGVAEENASLIPIKNRYT